MSEYRFDQGLRRSRTTRTREPEYVEETYVERGSAPAQRELVYRGPRDDSIEDIPRDFPPPGAEYRRTKVRENYGPPARRARSVGRRDHYDDEYDDYPPAPRGRPHREEAYYSDEYDRPPRRERRKSRVEGFLEDAGLGGIVGSVLGKKSRSKSRDRSRGREDRYGHHDRYDDRSRSRGRGNTERKWQQAAQAALVAGAVEAFRSRRDPGPWTGEKGTRIATAALGAAGIDGLVDRDPNKKSKRHTAEAVIGGLVANRLANGPRDRSGSRGRSRSRSMSRARSLFGRSQSRGRDGEGGGGGGAIKNLAGAGAIAAAGKAIYDRVRSKSRGRRRSGSTSSEDSYVPSRGRRYGRSRDRGPADHSGPAPGPAMRSSSMSSESTTDMEYQRKKMRAPPAGYGYGASTYADANPYSAGNLPPPPMGARY